MGNKAHTGTGLLVAILRGDVKLSRSVRSLSNARRTISSSLQHCCHAKTKDNHFVFMVEHFLNMWISDEFCSSPQASVWPESSVGGKQRQEKRDASRSTKRNRIYHPVELVT